MYYSRPKRGGRSLLFALGLLSRPRRGSPFALSGRAPRVPRHEMFRLGLATISYLEGSVSRFRWEWCVLGEQPDRATILPWMRYGVSVYKYILPHARGISSEQPFTPWCFSGEEIHNRVPVEFRQVGSSLGKLPPSFVEVASFRARRCVRSKSRFGRVSSCH